MSEAIQIKSAALTVNSPLAAELDDIYYALLGEADNPELYNKWLTAIDAYHDALLPSWSVRWKRTHCVPHRQPFKDLDRRSNLNALRRAVTAAKRSLVRVQRKGTMSERVAAEAALVAAQDALAIYRQHPTLLTHDELQSAIGAS